MPQWDDSGIILSVSRYGEQSAIVRLLTEHHGIQPGMVKGVFSKKSRGIFQPGNLVHAHWQTRLEEQLGTMRCELLTSVTAQLLSSPFALRLVNAATAVVSACVPERIVERSIFFCFNELINKIHQNDEEISQLYTYALLEHTLLQELGFGLNLRECAATGITEREKLVYISPKSGRAVCAEAGEPYKNKMLTLPAFLRDGESTTDMRQILDALALTGYFLESWVLHPEGRKMPEAKRELLTCIRAGKA